MNSFNQNRNPVGNFEAIVQGNCYRFTVLTPYMIRLEYSEKGVFEDRPTQMVVNRDFSVPNYKVIDKEESLEIIAEYLHIIYAEKPFSKSSLSIRLVGSFSEFSGVWYYGDLIKGNLNGTARTLDEADGAIELGDGLLSRNGYSVIDDSNSLVITSDDWVDVREDGIVDVYFFGYSDKYIDCLKNFYKLIGNTHYFGTELMVCPITKPMNNKLNVAEVKAWFPEGQ